MDADGQRVVVHPLHLDMRPQEFAEAEEVTIPEGCSTAAPAGMEKRILTGFHNLTRNPGIQLNERVSLRRSLELLTCLSRAVLA